MRIATLDPSNSRALDLTEALMVDIPVIIKAAEDSFGRRMFSVEASSEALDGEGDVIEQKALLDSASEFVKNGHIDWNHFSEIGARLGIPGVPSDWIIGNPREVVDLGEGRTGVIAEIRRSTDGSFDPNHRIFDAIWRDLAITTPPVNYRASIYGFPKAGMIEDCRKATCTSPATRFHIKGMDWKSLALTTNPVNDSLSGFARVVTAKSFIELAKSQYFKSTDSNPFPLPSQMAAPTESPFQGNPDLKAEPITAAPQSTAPSFPVQPPRCIADAIGQYHTHMAKCPHTAGLKSTAGFKNHFIACCGLDDTMADLYSHALMHSLLTLSRRV